MERQWGKEAVSVMDLIYDFGRAGLDLAEKVTKQRPEVADALGLQSFQLNCLWLIY